METPELFQFVGNRFSAILREWLTDDEMTDVLILNDKETAPSICHSAVYCDPNEAMLEAFRLVTGRGFDEDDEKQIEDDLELMTQAWEYAKKNRFKQVKHVITAKFHECVVSGQPIERGSTVLQITYRQKGRLFIDYIAHPDYLQHALTRY